MPEDNAATVEAVATETSSRSPNTIVFDGKAYALAELPPDALLLVGGINIAREMIERQQEDLQALADDTAAALGQLAQILDGVDSLGPAEEPTPEAA